MCDLSSSLYLVIISLLTYIPLLMNCICNLFPFPTPIQWVWVHQLSTCLSYGFLKLPEPARVPQRDKSKADHEFSVCGVGYGLMSSCCLMRCWCQTLKHFYCFGFCSPAGLSDVSWWSTPDVSTLLTHLLKLWIISAGSCTSKTAAGIIQTFRFINHTIQSHPDKTTCSILSLLMSLQGGFPHHCNHGLVC